MNKAILVSECLQLLALRYSQTAWSERDHRQSDSWNDERPCLGRIVMVASVAFVDAMSGSKWTSFAAMLSKVVYRYQ